jgi:hypothetical protein
MTRSVAGDRAAPPAVPDQRPNPGRFRRAWAAGLTVLLGLLFSVPTILTLTLWVTDATYALTNPVVDLAFFALGAMVVAGVAGQIRSPQPAGVQQAVLALLALAAAGAIGGRIEPLVGSLVLLVAVAPLGVVHRARDESRTSGARLDRISALLTLLAAGPSIAYAMVMLGWARNAGPSCFLGQCVQGDRYAEAAALAIAIVALALLASTGSRCRLLSAWSAGAAAALLGVVSLAVPGESGSLPAGGAAAAIAWGTAFITIAQLRHRPEAIALRHHRARR